MPVQRIVTLCRLALRGAARTCGLALIVAGTASAALAGGPPGSPEIDPGSAVSALAVLSGGILLLTDRLRRKA
jgi:hypothetical protein